MNEGEDANPGAVNRIEEGAQALPGGWNLHTLTDIERLSKRLSAGGSWVETVVPKRSLVLIAGDSNVGKTPLAYQLAIAVAEGESFLGFQTQQAQVVYCDFENGLEPLHEMAWRISRHLGVEAVHPNLRFLTVHDLPDQFRQPTSGVRPIVQMILDVQPNLVIIDSLGSTFPEAEEKNAAANVLFQELRGAISKCGNAGTSIVLIHHLRKKQDGLFGAGSLDEAKLGDWFNQVRGASALLNGTDVRIGVDQPGHNVTRKKTGSEVALVVRGMARICGEFSPIFLTRECDGEGAPLGYRALRGVETLFNDEFEIAYKKLTSQFRFKDLKNALGKADQSTANCVKRFLSAGLVRRCQGGYEKTQDVE
jgi:RecA/RadA recombinase